MDFLTAVCSQTVQFESDMYKPLVRCNCYPCLKYSYFELCTLLDTITDYIEDELEDGAETNEKHACEGFGFHSHAAGKSRGKVLYSY